MKRSPSPSLEYASSASAVVGRPTSPSLIKAEELKRWRERKSEREHELAQTAAGQASMLLSRGDVREVEVGQTTTRKPNGEEITNTRIKAFAFAEKKPCAGSCENSCAEHTSGPVEEVELAMECDEEEGSIEVEQPVSSFKDRAAKSIYKKRKKGKRVRKSCSFDEACSKVARKGGLCSAHGGGRRCQKEGCSKSAKGATDLCKAHGGGRRCQKEGCTKGAEGATDLCKAHGGGRRCQKEGCSKSARGATGFCSAHGGGKRCQKEGCSKGAMGATDFCIDHGGGRRCQKEGCSKSERGATGFCIDHGGGRRCVGPKPEDDKESCPYRLSAKSKYDTRCVRCFIAAFPNDTRALNAKAYLHCKELTVREFLETTFPQYRWTFDRTCAVGVFVRPDARTALGKTRLLIVEVDEHSHDTYVCDREREREGIFKKHTSRGSVVHVVRFNPDAYDDPVTGTRVPSCFRYSKEEGKASVPADRKADWEARLDKLRATIQEIIDHQHEDIQVPDLLLEDDRYKYVIPIELFYDNVREKWPDGNKQRAAAYKRNAKVRKAFNAECKGGGSSSQTLELSDSDESGAESE